jgi:2-iminobutanoate/2-iminopropanoate deaminase
LIITAGHLAAQPEIEASIEEQTHSALRELLATVGRAGGSAGSILRINAYLATMDDVESYDSVIREVIGLAERPTRTTVQIGGFKPPRLVEVDASAVALDNAYLT